MGSLGSGNPTSPFPHEFPPKTVPPSPNRSMVSLILLAAFSLSSPGWLLLMEKSVMTPVTKGRGGEVVMVVVVGGHPRRPQPHPAPTLDEEIAPHDEDEPDGCQDEAGAVPVVLVPHKADATDGVTVHLVEIGTINVGSTRRRHHHPKKTFHDLLAPLPAPRPGWPR